MNLNTQQYQLFEPASYGINIVGSQATLNPKSGKFVSQTNSLLNDRTNQETNQFLESKAFPNLTSRNPLPNENSALSGHRGPHTNQTLVTHIGNTESPAIRNRGPENINLAHAQALTMSGQESEMDAEDKRNVGHTLLNSVN